MWGFYPQSSDGASKDLRHRRHDLHALLRTVKREIMAGPAGVIEQSSVFERAGSMSPQSSPEPNLVGRLSRVSTWTLEDLHADDPMEDEDRRSFLEVDRPSGEVESVKERRASMPALFKGRSRSTPDKKSGAARAMPTTMLHSDIGGSGTSISAGARTALGALSAVNKASPPTSGRISSPHRPVRRSESIRPPFLNLLPSVEPQSRDLHLASSEATASLASVVRRSISQTSKESGGESQRK